MIIDLSFCRKGIMNCKDKIDEQIFDIKMDKRKMENIKFYILIGSILVTSVGIIILTPSVVALMSQYNIGDELFKYKVELNRELCDIREGLNRCYSEFISHDIKSFGNAKDSVLIGFDNLVRRETDFIRKLIIGGY